MTNCKVIAAWRGFGKSNTGAHISSIAFGKETLGFKNWQRLQCLLGLRSELLHADQTNPEWTNKASIWL